MERENAMGAKWVNKAAAPWAIASILSLSAVLLSACGEQGADPAAKVDSAAGPGQIAPSSVRSEAQMADDRQALIAALGAPAAPEDAAQYAGEFEAASEEPPWDLTLTADYVSFRRANLEPIEGRPRSREVRVGGLLVQTDDLVVTVKAGQCVFESGAAFPFSATVFWNGVSFEGCARPAAATGAVSLGWAVIVPRILPAIDACLGRADAKPARVTIAYPLDNGADLAVRVLEADNGRAECVVGLDGMTIKSYEGLADRDVFRGERDPLFTRAPTKPPAGRCDDNAPLSDGTGAVVGSLTRQKC
jgi:uncharacterized membrane protein